jgi:hypothetical protein
VKRSPQVIPHAQAFGGPQVYARSGAAIGAASLPGLMDMEVLEMVPSRCEDLIEDGVGWVVDVHRGGLPGRTGGRWWRGARRWRCYGVWVGRVPVRCQLHSCIRVLTGTIRTVHLRHPPSIVLVLNLSLKFAIDPHSLFQRFLGGPPLSGVACGGLDTGRQTSAMQDDIL